ncbi:MAG: AraC family transcriptional regulator, partial [Burkholderiaceae bacterium]|nr:AraC family transcriptional regulator [Burkholderiaceae bacterium]
YAGNLCSLVNFDAVEGVGHLHLLKAGRLQLTAPDGRVQELAEPSLIFFPRATRHRLGADEADGADLVCASVEFGTSFGNPLVHGLPPLLVLPLRDAPAMRGVLDALFTEAFDERSGRDAALNRLGEVVLVYLLRHAIEHGLLRSGVVAGLADARLAKALNAMHAAPQRPWTLQGLADLAGMSRARFAAHFGEVVGEPAIEYLAGWRLSVAQGLLTQGRQVKSIADEVGYGSPNALTRAFTQRLGQTPTEWLAQRNGRVPA